MTAEVIPNEQGGGDCQSSENDHDNDKQREGRGGRGGVSGDKEGGGGGRGRGRGREQQSLQKDKGGQEGNHSQEVEGGKKIHLTIT